MAFSILLLTSGCFVAAGAALTKRTISYAALHDPDQAGYCGDLSGQKRADCEAALAYEDPEVTAARAEFAAYLESRSLEDGWPDLCAAARRGHPDAQLIMARAYRHGWKPAKRNDGTAYQWYLRAQTGGQPAAQRELKTLTATLQPAMIEVQRQRAKKWEPDRKDCPAPDPAKPVEAKEGAAQSSAL